MKEVLRTGAIHRNLHLYDIYHDLPMNLSWDKSKFPTNHTKYVFIYIYMVCVCNYIYCIPGVYIYMYFIYLFTDIDDHTIIDYF